MDKERLGLYIHIPYCIAKCRYCDFVSYPLDKAKQSPDDYANAICNEIIVASKKYADKFAIDTIFFGGGTPTCIGTDLIGRILLMIRHHFELMQDAEISIEANPETITEQKASALKFLGFNRVSMGVQSLDNNVLKIMGRVHTAEKAKESYQLLRQVGFNNINLDLMLGVPAQSFNVFKTTIDETISLKPEHISFYSLQLEEGTPFYNEYKNGDLQIPSWEENRQMYHYAVNTLKQNGYHHYEISNAAVNGFECKHNLKYWTMKPYLGFGTAAHSFIDGKRTGDDHPNLETDWLFTGLRLIDGTDFGSEIIARHKITIDELVDEGYLLLDGTTLKFTDKGLDCTNNCIARLIND